MMYTKLIFKNAKRSGKDYLIYIVTMTLCVTLFYAFLSISSTHYHPTIGAEYNISLLAGGMKLAICGISLLLLFLIIDNEIDLFASVVQDDHMVLPTVSIAGSFQRQKAHQKS